MTLRPASLAVFGLLAALSSASEVVHAAERTYVPPMLRGDAFVGYDASADLVRLRDRATNEQPYSEVGSYTRHHQGMLVSGSFTPYHGIAVGLELPIVFVDQLDWSGAQNMRYDAEAGRATMAGGNTLSENTLDASTSSRLHTGPGDLIFRVRGLPFAERGVPGREAAATLALDFGLRFPSGGHHDRVREDGNAGPGVGGMGLEVGATASRRYAGVEPYLSIHYRHNAPYAVDLIDGNGQAVPAPEGEDKLMLDPADEFSLGFGGEIIAIEQDDGDRSVRMNIGIGATYRSPSQVSSGTRLPSPLGSTVGQPATTGEHVRLSAGLGIAIRPKAPIEIHAQVEGNWRSPHSVERVSNLAYWTETSPDSFWLQWGVGTRIRFR